MKRSSAFPGWRKTRRPWLFPAICISGVICSLAYGALVSANAQPTEQGSSLCQRDLDISLLEDYQFLIFGEVHGTNEIPSIFSDYVCAFGSKEPVAVGVEWPAHSSTQLNDYISSRENGDEQVPLRIAAEMSGQQGADGRSTLAIVEMLERLRALKLAGLDITVVPFVPDSSDINGGQDAYERALADKLMANIPTGRRALILVGNVHAQRAKFEISDGLGFMPMAAHFPEDATLGLAPRIASGSAWNCSAQGCGANPVPARDLSGYPEIEVFEQDRSGYGGAWLIGRVSASPPAKLSER